MDMDKTTEGLEIKLFQHKLRNLIGTAMTFQPKADWCSMTDSYEKLKSVKEMEEQQKKAIKSYVK